MPTATELRRLAEPKVHIIDPADRARLRAQLLKQKIRSQIFLTQKTGAADPEQTADPEPPSAPESLNIRSTTEDRMKTWTLYRLRNNGKIYIGITCKTIKERLWWHELHLRAGTHGNMFLTQDFPENWKPTIRAVQVFDNKEDARLAEEALILKTPLAKCYNVRLKRKGVRRAHATPEERAKASAEVRALIDTGIKITKATQIVAPKYNAAPVTVHNWVIKYQKQPYKTLAQIKKERNQ